MQTLANLKSSIALSLVLYLNVLRLHAQIQSIGGGNRNWNSTTSWVGGVVPTSTDDVIIAASDTIRVQNSSPNCRNITFGNNDAKIEMTNSNSKLSIYGDFTIFSTTHNPFTTWTTGSVVRFSGGQTIQTISGYPANNPPPFSFDSLEINKTAGTKVITSGTGMRLGLTKGLNIINGNFELSNGDDIEGRNTSGSTSGGPFKPVITVGSGDTLTMTSVNSHIRSGANTGDNDSKIGKLTVFGVVSFSSGHANRINFDNVDVEDGGVFEIRSSGTVTGVFNLGKLLIKDNGYFKTSNNTNSYWYTNNTTPNELEIESGGEFEINGTSNENILPQVVTLQSGSWVRYSSTPTNISSDPKLAIYQNVRFIGNAKTLTQNITVNDTLSMRTSSTSVPSIVLNSFTLTYGSSATLEYRGIGSPQPAQTTTNIEWPTTGSIPKNVQIYNASGVTLNSDKSILGRLSFRGNTGISAKLITGNFNITVDSCFGFDQDKYVATTGTGKLTYTNIGSTTKTIAIGNSRYNPLTITNGSNLNWSINLEDSVVKSYPGAILGAVLRTWNITPSTNPPPSGADLTFQYNDGDATQIGSLFDVNKNVQLWHHNTQDWFAAGVTQSPTGTPSGIRTASINNWTDFSPFAISNFDFILPSENILLKAQKNQNNIQVSWSVSNRNQYREFHLQKSTNGIAFTNIFNIAANSTNQYSFNDFNPQLHNYYRLALVEQNGNISYSKIIYQKAISNLTLQAVHLSKDQLKITTDAEFPISFHILDASGKIHITDKVQKTTLLNVGKLSPGVYFLKTNHQTIKFIHP
jgi:hypothetical protein